ncbi:MAG: AAA family ATPase [Nitrososphaerales archaeon]
MVAGEYALIGITGNPATGKKSVASLLSRKFRLDLIDLNSFAKLHSAKGNINESNVNTVLLGKELRDYLVGRTRGAIVSGHLLPSVLSEIDLDIVIVLRCSPERLLDRYRNRGYSKKKIKENIIAEAIGVISSAVLKCFEMPKVAEIDTSKTNPAEVAQVISSILKGKTEKRVGLIDWLPTMINNEDLRSLLH